VSKQRLEERWAASLMSADLGVPVTVHDDGRRESMYDLTIRYLDRSPGAGEVTTVTDGPSVALWKLINPPQRWCEPQLAGGWSVGLEPTASAKLIKRQLPGILAKLEAAGIREARPRPRRDPLQLWDLGIRHLFQSPGTDFPGSIYPTLALPHEQTGGVVPHHTNALADWLSSWISDPIRADNLRKLAASGADERHLFVIFRGFSGAPFQVADALMRDEAQPPEMDPDLPPELTHLWAVSLWNMGHGFRWAPDTGWTRFDKFPAA
jgi:hypothetical protein